jgi:hypothetical protein
MARSTASFRPDSQRPGLVSVVMPTDEDIHLVFAVADVCILTCETSARLMSESKVLPRIDFGEVLLAAR